MVPVFDKAFREEVQLVYNVLTHPAGFHIGVFGLLEVRSTDQDVYEVSWDRGMNGHWRTQNGTHPWRLYHSALRAAMVYCHLRRALDLGVDCEAAACSLAAVTGS